MRTGVKNARIVTATEILENAFCTFSDGVIDYVGANPPAVDEWIDAEGGYLVPGFIDLHCHGGNGLEFMDASEEEIGKIADFHLAHGTTTMLATTLAAFQAKRDALTAQITQLTQGQPLEQCLQNWQEVSHKWEQLTQAQQAHNDALAHALALQAMLKPVAKPEMADELTLDEAETLRMADSTAFQLRQGQLRLGQLQGRMDALGDENALRHQLREVELRLEKLEKTYAALELAQQTLANASEQLQRRFAPRIAEQARELFGRLTGGRSDRLNLTQELSVDTATTEDIAIRSAQWRSEGTVDQLYLALRLAVARELTPNAPLVLDDALVRFDDVRHAAAMEILRQEAQRKQVILFTCQSREC